KDIRDGIICTLSCRRIRRITMAGAPLRPRLRSPRCTRTDRPYPCFPGTRHAPHLDPQGSAREDAMNKDELKGKAEKAKGYVKEEAGELTGDRDLEAEGRSERAIGAAREKFGKARKKVGEAVEELGDEIKGE